VGQEIANGKGFSEDIEKSKRLLEDLTQRGLGRTSQPADIAATQTTPDDLALVKMAVERGLLTLEQLEECLRLQREASTAGTALSLGSILVEQGHLKSESLLELFREQVHSPPGVPQLSRYEVRGKLGEGATAVVYRGWDRELKRPVALKVLRDVVGLSQVSRERFHREAQAAAAMAHPNVLQVYDAGDVGGQLYIVMELVDGRPFSEILKARNLGQKELVRILEKVARGVAVAHEKGIVHRDLKPANILVSASGEPKVGDFGLAHLPETSTALTKTGATLGTPLYMSPEQVEGRPKDISARTDVYALGAILYEILALRPPHTGDTLPEIYGKITHEEAVSPKKLQANASTDLATIALKALEKKPERRYPGAQAFADDLLRALEDQPIEARPVSRAERLWRRGVKYRVLLGGAALIALIGILVGGFVSRRGSHLAGIVFLERLDGEVTITHGGKSGPARVGQILASGDALETGPWPSRGVLRFQNETTIEVGPDTRVGDVSLEPDRRLGVRNGTIRADLMKQSPVEPITFVTPHGEVKGTRSALRINVSSDPAQGTRIEVEDGQAEVRKPSGERILIEGGSFAIAAKGLDLMATPIALALDFGGGGKMEFIAIKPGTFTMGGTMEPAPWLADERPIHRVVLTKGFAMGKYPVTRGQFAAFVKATGYQTDGERIGKAWGRSPTGQWQEVPGNTWRTPARFTQTDDHPVVCVSWNDAKAFCDWATKATGRAVTLPTEAEWEYVCRAGTRTRWSFGDEELAFADHEWCSTNSGMQTHPVGQKKRNPWGLYDMGGNVLVWCQDFTGPYSGDAVDPTGPPTGENRILRGGNWRIGPVGSSTRGSALPSNKGSDIGFRVCLR
jgi:formylglycine-generating enzyme required for sulfatase activity/predicted Ser/Thr protein kinase